MTPSKRPRRRGLRQTLTCALVVIALQLSLLAVPELPDPVSELGTQAAAAQTPPPQVTVTNGTPDACPPVNGIDWSPASSSDPNWLTAEECTLELPACPESPLHSPATGVFMRLSSPPAAFDTSRFPVSIQPDVDYSAHGAALDVYPDFCELRVDDSEPEYAACTGTTTGFVVRTYHYGTPRVDGCRLLRPRGCPGGLQLATPMTCRGVQRRTWTCSSINEVPHNIFNRCVETGPPPASNPACSTAAPEIPLISCASYAGGDLFTSPAAVNCAIDYPTGTPVVIGAPTFTLAPVPTSSALTRPQADHWCEYDANALRAECHQASGAPPDCAPAATALCLKRASRTGGCAAIAHTIRCRAYVQAFATVPSTVTLEQVRQDGCSPCLVLPFRPIPDRCPPDTQGPAPIGRFYPGVGGGTYTEQSDLTTLHDAPPPNHLCDGLPSGSLSVTPTHPSGRSVVNSAVIVTLEGPVLELDPDKLRRRHLIYYRPNLPLERDPQDHAELRFDEDLGLADNRVRTWREPTSTSTYNFLEDIAGATECTVTGQVTFRLIVEELWPDDGPNFPVGPNCGGVSPSRGTDAWEILNLFGPDSLNWWCELDEDGRKRRTAARGIAWWPDTGGTLAAQQQRDRRLNTTEPCAMGIPTVWSRSGRVEVPRSEIWCHWVPLRPGYYRLHAGGAWSVIVYSNVSERVLTPASELGQIVSYLNETALGTQRRACRRFDYRNQKWIEEVGVELGRSRRDCTDYQLTSLLGLTWADIGLNFMDINTPISVIPLNPDRDWKYTAPNAAGTNCPSIDLRVRCAGTRDEAYTRSPPIGVLVHEARVVTRAPS